MRHFITFSLSTLLLVGCAYKTSNYYTETVQSWRGGNAKTLVKTWGRPDSVARTQEGNTVYFYNTRSYAHSSTQMSPATSLHVHRNGQTSMSHASNRTSHWNRGAISMVCTAAFIVNKHGTVTDIKTEGSGCYGSESFANHLKNPKG